MNRIALVLALALAACPGSRKQTAAPLADPVSGSERDMRADLVAELQDEILKSYERDEPPETESGMWLPEIGPARIGVGPEDVLVAAEVGRARTRWPLALAPATVTDPRSKRLEIHLAKDQSAAWVFDEISWRLKMCGRTAVIPFRLTALYARDGDRWVPVFEHVSFARPPTPLRAGQKPPRQIFTAVASRDLVDDLSRALSPILRRAIDKAQTVARGPESGLLGVDLASEWHGADVVQAKLVAGSDPMKLEDRRVGIVGRSLAKATIAYWVGNVTADLPARPGVEAGKGHFRGSFVFEKRDGAWIVVQGQLSQAIDDTELATAVFGTSLISAKPLSISCDDGSRQSDSKTPRAITGP